MRNLYVAQEETVRTEHKTTDRFKIGKGVQGCILSPCLFNLYTGLSTLIGCGLWSPQIIKERQRSLMTDHHKNIIIVKKFEILKEFQECDAQT